MASSYSTSSGPTTWPGVHRPLEHVAVEGRSQHVVVEAGLELGEHLATLGHPALHPRHVEARRFQVAFRQQLLGGQGRGPLQVATQLGELVLVAAQGQLRLGQVGSHLAVVEARQHLPGRHRFALLAAQLQQAGAHRRHQLVTLLRPDAAGEGEDPADVFPHDLDDLDLGRLGRPHAHLPGADSHEGDDEEQQSDTDQLLHGAVSSDNSRFASTRRADAGQSG